MIYGSSLLPWRNPEKAFFLILVDEGEEAHSRLSVPQSLRRGSHAVVPELWSLWLSPAHFPVKHISFLIWFNGVACMNSCWGPNAKLFSCSIFFCHHVKHEKFQHSKFISFLITWTKTLPRQAWQMLFLLFRNLPNSWKDFSSKSPPNWSKFKDKSHLWKETKGGKF